MMTHALLNRWIDLRRILWAGLLGMLLAGARAGAAGPEGAVRDGVEVAVAPDRPTGIYKVGEKVTFRVRVTRDGKPVGDEQITLKTQVVGGGKNDIQTANVKLDHGQLTAVREFQSAGNMILEASYAFDQGGVTILFGTELTL